MVQDDQEVLYPIEFLVAATPISLQGSSRSRELWRATVREAAQERVRESVELSFLDRRPIAVTVYYFPAAPMDGDLDNIVKPILDALINVTYMNDRDVERVVVQKFEPQVGWGFADPSDRLTRALDTAPPVVYIRVDDDLSWRRLA